MKIISFVYIIFLIVFLCSIKSGASNCRPYVPTPGADIQKHANTYSITYIDQLFSSIEKQGNYTQNFLPSDINTLPVGIKKEMGNNEYTIAFSKITYLEGHAELTVFGRIAIPQGDNGKETELAFVGDRIKYTPEGGIENGARLVLVGDIPFEILGGNATLIINGAPEEQIQQGNYSGETYISFDCEGFKELSIDADILFPTSLIVPVDANGEILNGQVQGHFQTAVADWNDILINLSLPDFAVNNVPGFSFSIKNAVFDFSDTKNSTNTFFPDNYRQYLISGNEQLWKGVYIHDMLIRFPDEFKSRQSGQPVSVGAQGLLVDEFGVSGLFSLHNILSFNEGSASGWKFSVNSFNMGLLASQITEMGFAGRIVLPVSDTTSLGYTAVWSDKNWLMAVKTTEDIDFNLWAATATLASNSSVIFQEEDGNFLPEANLNGSISLSSMGSGSDKVADIKDIKFQDLHLKTTGQKISIGYLGYNGEAKLGNFPVTISNIEARTFGDDFALHCDLNLNLDEKASQSFSATGGFQVIGSITEENEIFRPKYQKTTVDQFNISADFSALTIDGYIQIMKNDPVYGDGFAGGMELSLKPDAFSGVNLQANAVFGRKDFRYWAVDGSISGIKAGTPAFAITGFGGGISSRMQQVSNPGSTFTSGIGYVPRDENGLGLMSCITFNFGQAANGNTGFNIQFNQHGGLNRMGLFGEAEIAASAMAKSGIADKIQEKLKGLASNMSQAGGDKLATLQERSWLDCSTDIYPTSFSASANIKCDLGIDYDFNSSTLHGDFNVYVSTPGGFIRGRGNNNRAGWAVYHMSPDCWYLHAGTPSDRLGLVTQIGPVKIKNGGYFMLGDEIPDFPDPPQKVVNIIGDYQRGFDMAALGTGRGICFGTDFSVETGDLTFLFLFASFDAGLGFDVMLRDYGNVHCVGDTDPIGMNGWYAQGQAYAYLAGKLGLRIKVFGIKKKLTILEGATATLLKAGLPNPIWFEGYLAGNYRLLGGAVKGKYRFKLSLGDQCELAGGSPLDGMKVIADISPGDGSKEIDVFTSPQVAFNLPVGKDINIGAENGDDLWCRVILDKFWLTTEDGQQIDGFKIWNDAKDMLTFETKEILPEQQKITADVTVSFKEKVNGSWQVYKDGNGKAPTENMKVTFTSGVAPNYIPTDNIAYMYPVVGQKNCFIEETDKGYIKLKKGQPNILPAPDGYTQQLVFTPEDGYGNIKAGSSSDNSDIVTFGLSGILKAGTKYTFLLTNEPKELAGNNYTETTQTTEIADGNTVEITNKEISTAVLSSEGYELLNFDFRTSKYKTWAKKLETAKVSDVDYLLSGFNGGVFKADLRKDFELCDEVDLKGNRYTGGLPLITPGSLLTDSYYKNFIAPLIYEDYPLGGKVVLSRSTDIPPLKGAYVDETFFALSPAFAVTKFPYLYNQFESYYSDFHELRDKAAALYNKSGQWFPIVGKQFIWPKYDTYKIELKYNLPNGDKGTKGREIAFNN